MSRKLATVRLIKDILPIKDADRIELAVIDGWHCVIEKGQFEVGDAVVFFEIDSAIDPDDSRFAFLKERFYKEWKRGDGSVVDSCIRIRTCKFKGVVSQGLAMPLTLFTELKCESIPMGIAAFVGQDLTELLHVRHFDDVQEAANDALGINTRLAGEAAGYFPIKLVSKTDEERLQNLPEFFTTKKGILFECTEKNDGSSMTVIYSPTERPDNPFYVCSRNLELKESADNSYWKMAIKYNLKNVLDHYYRVTGKELALQGELVGPGVNANRDHYMEMEFHVFRIFNITDHCWFTPQGRVDFCKNYELPHVKVIKTDWDAFNELHTIDDFVAFVAGKTDNGNEREGMVWKANDGSCSFKIINPEYLLKEK